jgi:hypothetical protein
LDQYMCPISWAVIQRQNASGRSARREVCFHAPDGYAVGASAQFDSSSGEYRAEGIAEFGLFIGKGNETAEADAGDVRVRAVFTAAGRPCAVGPHAQNFAVPVKRDSADGSPRIVAEPDSLGAFEA